MGQPERPKFILVANHMRAEYAVVAREMKRMGVQCRLETREEALATATAHDTDPEDRKSVV